MEYLPMSTSESLCNHRTSSGLTSNFHFQQAARSHVSPRSAPLASLPWYRYYKMTRNEIWILKRPPDTGPSPLPWAQGGRGAAALPVWKEKKKGRAGGRGGRGRVPVLLLRLTEAQPSLPPPPAARHPAPRAPPPPRMRRAFTASRWNTNAARRSPPPNCTALAPTSRPSTSAESECTHRSASSRDGNNAGSSVNASDA
jgi:hypothetical protein